MSKTGLQVCVYLLFWCIHPDDDDVVVVQNYAHKFNTILVSLLARNKKTKISSLMSIYLYSSCDRW